MPRFRQNRNRTNERRNQSQSQSQQPGHAYNESIPFYNARLFAMHESLIQSYAHFTYHANYMFNALVQSLHGAQNMQPWTFIPPPPPQAQQPQAQQPQAQQPQAQQPQAQQPQAQQPLRQQQPQAQQPLRQQPLGDQGTTSRLETNIINALFGLITRPLEEPRLTQAQLNDRIQYALFETIVNPMNTICSITHDVFEPTQRVARIRHCGHIFNPTSLAQWLRINNTCPTCRHNLLSGPVQAREQEGEQGEQERDPGPRSRIDIPLESEININTFYNELLRNSANIPGFELNAVDDNSVVFSFDLMSDRPRPNGGAPNGGAPNGPSNIDDLD